MDGIYRLSISFTQIRKNRCGTTDEQKKEDTATKEITVENIGIERDSLDIVNIDGAADPSTEQFKAFKDFLNDYIKDSGVFGEGTNCRVLSDD